MSIETKVVKPTEIVPIQTAASRIADGYVRAGERLHKHAMSQPEGSHLRKASLRKSDELYAKARALQAIADE